MRYILLITLFIASCGDRPAGFDLINYKSITLSDSSAYLLPKIYPFAISNSSESSLLFSNMRNPLALIETDLEGNLQKKVGKYGRGPSEILSARYFAYDQNNEIFIYDKTLGMIKHFNSSYIDSYQSPIPSGFDIRAKAFFKCKDYWYAGIKELSSEKKQDPLIVKLDSSFNMVNKFGEYDKYFGNNKSILEEPVMFLSCEDSIIATSHGKLPYTKIYSMKNQKLIGKTEIIPEKFKLSKEFIDKINDQRVLKDYTVNKQSITLFIGFNEDLLFSIFKNTTNSFYENRNPFANNYYIAAYNKNTFNYLGTVSLDGVPIGITSKGKVIKLMSDNLDNYVINLDKVVFKADKQN